MELYFYSALIILAVLLAKTITGIGPIQMVFWIWGKLKEGLQRLSGKTHSSNKRKFSQMSRREKKKSVRYRFHLFINEIILDMEWNTKGITVEGVNSLLQGITAFVFLALLISFRNTLVILMILVPAIVSVIFYIVSIAALYLLSRVNHMRRKTALMDAEDIICANMGNGVVESIENSINSFDPAIKPIFLKFLDEVYNRNVSVDTAVNNLNDSCGEQFDMFCDKVKTYERERRPGMEQVFQYNISQNAFVRRLDRDCNKAFSAMNKNYWLSLGIILGFIVYNFISYGAMAEFYMSTFGKVLLSIYFALAALCFVFIQYLQSKPFVYGKGMQNIMDEDASLLYNVNGFESQTRLFTRIVAPIDSQTEKIANIMKSKKKGG